MIMTMTEKENIPQIVESIPSNYLCYAERGVHQCWICSNNIGNKVCTLTVADEDGVPREIHVLLPECKVADQYMLYTTKVPCYKFEMKNFEAKNNDETGKTKQDRHAQTTARGNRGNNSGRGH